MPHGGYHGTVELGGNVIQQGYQDSSGDYQVRGGIDDASRLDKNPPTVVTQNIAPLSSDKIPQTVIPLDEDDIREAYIAGSNIFIPRGKPGEDVRIEREGIFASPTVSGFRTFDGERKPVDISPAGAFSAGIANQLYNLYGDNRPELFSRVRPEIGTDFILRFPDAPETKQESDRTINVFGKNIKLPEMPLFGKPIKDLSEDDLNKILDEVKRYQEGLPNYFEGFPGGLNIAKGFADSITQGETREDGTPTLQGLKKFIRNLDPDSNMLESFAKADPTTYLEVFGLPATDAGLERFANMPIGKADKKTSQLIMEARKRLQDAQSRQDANMGQGIMAASPALPGISVPAGGTVSSSAVTPNPVLTPVPVGGVAPTTTGITPFDINKFYASLPQYTQQGIMAPTNLSRFTDALRMFPGATV